MTNAPMRMWLCRIAWMIVIGSGRVFVAVALVRLSMRMTANHNTQSANQETRSHDHDYRSR